MLFRPVKQLVLAKLLIKRKMEEKRKTVQQTQREGSGGRELELENFIVQ